ncbi:protein kinase [Aeromonas phage PZL-Ah1]|nr:protein kinase [Aeromonas phage PZL-Ah1]
MNVNAISARVSEIAALGLSELTKRQPMLVELIADIVNHETENGYLTMKEGNRALTVMPYWNSLMVYLKDAGFELLGNGHFSAAFKHRLLPQKVIKVGFKKEDSGAAYAAFCRMNQGKQGIPTIHDIQRHAGCYTVVLDELRPLVTTLWGDVNEHSEDESVVDQFNVVRGIISYDETFDGGVDPLLDDLAETAKEIRKFFDGIASFDMHSGNAMVDSNGHVIITDPVSFTDKAVDHARDDFMIDPEELLKEIEQLAELRMIERCRGRKAKRDPSGQFQKSRKVRARNRRKFNKIAKRGERELAQVKLQRHNEMRDEEQARLVMGTHHWKNCWARMANLDFAKLEQRVAANFREAERQAIAMGKPLAIDKILDGWFQG